MQQTEYDITVPSELQFQRVQGSSTSNLQVYANDYMVWVVLNTTASQLPTLNAWTDIGVTVDEAYRPNYVVASPVGTQKSNIGIRVNTDGKVQYMNNGSALSSGARVTATFFYPRKSALP